MSYIHFSMVGGKIPTVAQLETAESKMGYNRVDGLFYALKIANGVKSVICIGGGGVVITPGNESRMNQLNSGTVVWLHDLVFRVSNCNYYIQGFIYSSSLAEVTLQAADAVNPRIDVIYVNKNSQVGVLKGIAEANPAKPIVDPLTQLELTQIFVPANATEPQDINDEQVYQENVEWATSVAGTYAGVTINFNDATTPASGAKQTRISKTGSIFGAAAVQFTKSDPLYNAQGATLILSIRTSRAFGNNTALGITLKSYNAQIGNKILIKNGSYGFVGSTLTWQTIAIPFSDFSASSSMINTVHISFAGTWNTAPMSLDLDDIKLQGGVTPGITVETDPVFQSWLATNPLANFLTEETEPDFNAWLLTYPGPGITEEEDPLFAAWLLTNPLAGFLSAETDPEFNAWLLTNPIPAAQIQSDWNQSNNTLLDFIKNKPTIPSAQIQSDWNQANSGLLDFIKNKPTIPSVPVKATGAEIATGTDDAKFATPKAMADAEVARIHAGLTPPTDTTMYWFDTN